VPSLLLAAIFFAGIHLGIAGTTIRDRAIAALGESAYTVAFSLVSVVGSGLPGSWRPTIVPLTLPPGECSNGGSRSR
jgi:NnrU protein